jgi:SAM-dependent methyltransferase
MARQPIDFTKRPRRSHFEAKILDSSAGRMHAQHGRRKADVIGAMTGTVVEIGPGTGVNMRYYAPGVHVIAIEPNPTMHTRLRQRAAEHGVDLEVRALRGEGIDVDDASSDGVVGTLVLCGVDDPHRVVGEVHRVLKPGGTFFFLEHVVAPTGTITRRVQQVVKRPHRWLFNGCEVDRNTTAVLHDAGFAQIEIDAVDIGIAGMYARHHIVGTAIR